MPRALWDSVDDYITTTLLPSDPALAATLATSATEGLPPIQVSPAQGRLLELLARSCGARRILEVGTLGGYSTIWLARALPDGGRVVSLEVDPHHADVARRNVTDAGMADRVAVRTGPALVTLPLLAEEGARPFDLVFIDADKPANPDYLTWALRLTRPGSLIIIDNVIRDGAVLDAESEDAGVLGVRRCFDMVAAEPRLIGTAIQTVGSKGYDGFAIALVVDVA